MEMPLKPTSTNFYTSSLEKIVTNTILDTEIYCGYIEGIFLVVNNFKISKILQNLWNKLRNAIQLWNGTNKILFLKVLVVCKSENFLLLRIR